MIAFDFNQLLSIHRSIQVHYDKRQVVWISHWFPPFSHFNSHNFIITMLNGSDSKTDPSFGPWLDPFHPHLSLTPVVSCCRYHFFRWTFEWSSTSIAETAFGTVVSLLLWDFLFYEMSGVHEFKYKRKKNCKAFLCRRVVFCDNGIYEEVEGIVYSITQIWFCGV